MIQCSKCKVEQISNFPPQSYFELHHIIPKSIGGTDKEGRIYLCQKCHDVIHHTLNKVIFSYVENKDKCKEGIKHFTTKWIS